MFNLSKASDLLDLILDEHQDNLAEARLFGVKTAALPKGLMSYKDAQKVVASFEKDTEKLSKFLESMFRTSPPPGMETEFNALVKKAEASLKKFQSDKKIAQDALERHEDILVGEYFQTAFEALRHAVLDLDLADDADVDFKTKLFLDNDPAYGMGHIELSLNGAKVLSLNMGYRASNDMYWGDVKVISSNKTIPMVAQKLGHAFLPKFVREFSEQTKAVSDKFGLNLFKSRKKVEPKFLVLDVAKIRPEVTEALKQWSAKHLGGSLGAGAGSYISSVSVNDNGSGMAFLSLNGLSWQTTTYTQVLGIVNSFNSAIEFAVPRSPFEIKLPSGYKFDLKFGPFAIPPVFLVYTNQARAIVLDPRRPELRPIEWRDELPSIEILRARAKELGINPTPFGAKKVELLREIRNNGLKIRNLQLQIENPILRFQVKSSSSASKVAVRHMTAGGTDFQVYIEDKNVDTAFQKARDKYRNERGSDSYSGTIKEKSDYKVRSHEVRNMNDAQKFVDQDIEGNQKWGPAFAIPVSKEKVLKTENVTVTIEAKDLNDARKRGSIKIKATGRIPPNASIIVNVKGVKEVPGAGVRVKTFEVIGERKAVLSGDVTGWLFYGVASS